MIVESTKVEASTNVLPFAKPMLAVRACGFCGFPNVKPALKVNDVDVGHCFLSFIDNLSKCNGTTLIEELESQTKYINSKN